MLSFEAVEFGNHWGGTWYHFYLQFDTPETELKSLTFTITYEDEALTAVINDVFADSQVLVTRLSDGASDLGPYHFSPDLQKAYFAVPIEPATGYTNIGDVSYSASVPGPSPLILLALGLSALWAIRRKFAS
jgi:MYXO-CTERM domain-containing protein